MRRFAVVIAVSLLAGCTITSDAEGDATFTKREVDLKVGETTTLEVAQALGPPDRILRRDYNELWFIYRYVEVKKTKITFRVADADSITLPISMNAVEAKVARAGATPD